MNLDKGRFLNVYLGCFLFIRKFKMKKILLGIVGFWLLSSSVMAGEWVGWTTVNEVYVSSGGSVLAKFETMENPEGCSSTSWVKTEYTNVSRKEIYSMLLTALAADKEVRYYINGCNTYATMTHTMVRREPD